MAKETVEKVKVISDLAKTFLMLGAALCSVVIWSYSTFATNSRVDKLESRVDEHKDLIEDQKKISCLTALEVGVSREKLPRICSLDK